MYHLVTLSILHEEARNPCAAPITLKNYPVYSQVFFRVWEIHSAENLPSAAQLHTDPEPVLTNVAPPIAPPTGLRERKGPSNLYSYGTVFTSVKPSEERNCEIITAPLVPMPLSRACYRYLMTSERIALHHKPL